MALEQVNDRAQDVFSDRTRLSNGGSEMSQRTARLDGAARLEIDGGAAMTGRG